MTQVGPMNLNQNIVGMLMAGLGIVGAYYTANMSINNRIDAVNAEVQVLQERQANQYDQLKEELDAISNKVGATNYSSVK